VGVGLDLFKRERGHHVTCNRLFRSAARLGGCRPLAQSYVGKPVALKGITGAYRSLVSCQGPRAAGFHDSLADGPPVVEKLRMANPRWKNRTAHARMGEGAAGAEPSVQQSCARGADATDLLQTKISASRCAVQLNEGLAEPN
jgi:hypothetical protein